MEEKKLGLRSVVSTSVGLVIATSCLVSLGQGAGEIGIVFIGAMIAACLLNLTTIASLSELNALMPNITGGLAQYTLACMDLSPPLSRWWADTCFATFCHPVLRLLFLPMRCHRSFRFRFQALCTRQL